MVDENRYFCRVEVEPMQDLVSITVDAWYFYKLLQDLPRKNNGVVLATIFRWKWYVVFKQQTFSRPTLKRKKIKKQLKYVVPQCNWFTDDEASIPNMKYHIGKSNTDLFGVCSSRGVDDSENSVYTLVILW